MFIQIITACLHLFWCYLFVHVFYWDITGVAIATFITYFSNFVIVTIYCYLDKSLKDMYFFLTKDTFNELLDFLKVGLPSASMICFEWWSYEVLALMAGYISI
jgi:MATE family multidrug resistance protein